MIKEYTLRLKRRGGEAPLEYADAYPLYAALLELAGTRTAQNLHEEGRPSLSPSMGIRYCEREGRPSS